MMIGVGNHHNTTVHVPPWHLLDDPTAGMSFCHPVSGVTEEAALAELRRLLPSNESYSPDDSDEPELADPPVDVYSSDEFRMYEFKVRRCARGRSHDWTECPYAHPGEKARRRDPRRFSYSGTACPDFRKGSCKRGESCEFAHGVFECWLHPTRYRTQPCKDGTACRRRVCFFAHTQEQRRMLAQQQQSPRTPKAPPPDSYDGSPIRQQASLEAYFPNNLISSPMSTLITPAVSSPSDSPPVSPSGMGNWRRAVPFSSSVNEVVAAMRKLQISKARSAPCAGLFGFASPRGAGFSSLPATPMGMRAASSGDGWPEERSETVQFGRDSRNVENTVEESDGGAAMAVPDLGWVSELVK